jgi:hypothetical protein
MKETKQKRKKPASHHLASQVASQSVSQLWPYYQDGREKRRRKKGKGKKS